MAARTDLLIPLKPLHAAKTRLRGSRNDAEHAALVRAFTLDTVLAARQCEQLRRLVVVTSDEHMTRTLIEYEVEVISDVPASGLNAALTYGSDVLLRDDPHSRIGALGADLPALRHEDLCAALRSAGNDRAFCADARGTGTTLLLAARAAALRPCFGEDSARQHRLSGARPLRDRLESLRRDVDTEEDLRIASTIGLGEHTSAICPEMASDKS